MKRIHIAATIAAFVLMGGIAVAGAQSAGSNVKPTAGIDSEPRSLNFNRTGGADSTMAGGPGYTWPSNPIRLPTECERNPTAAGCPGFCEANPTAPGCGGGDGEDYCAANPADPVCGGGDVCSINPGAPGCPAQNPPPGDVDDTDHCGVPRDYPLNRDPNCTPVAGGWKCYRAGTGTIFYVCP